MWTKCRGTDGLSGALFPDAFGEFKLIRLELISMTFLVRKTLVSKTSSRFFAALAVVPIALCSSTMAIHAQPANPPAIAPPPRLTLTAEQEYIIREVILKDVNVPKQESAPETIGDPVPDNITLFPLPSEIVQKVPKTQSHKFFVKDDKVILVSPSDRRIADVIQKKSSD